jgi:predicted O-methyltransferase YrrM
MARLKSFVQPDGNPLLFLIPDSAVAEVYDCIVSNRLQSCLELGTGYGTTSCVMAAAADAIGGRVIAVENQRHPVTPEMLKQHVGLSENPTVVVEKLGYNWYLADLISQNTRDGVCRPVFDFCFLDGAHEWLPDALAFFLIEKLLKPGGWLVLDGVNFRLRGCQPHWEKVFGHLSDRELDVCQVGMVFDLVVRQHPGFHDFRVSHDGRIGWARKKAGGVSEADFEEVRNRVQATAGQLRRSQELIRAMESSRFWKLRSGWFKIKKLVGLDADVN